MQNHDSENKIKTQESIITQLQDKNKRLQETVDYLTDKKKRFFSCLVALCALAIILILIH